MCVRTQIHACVVSSAHNFHCAPLCPTLLGRRHDNKRAELGRHFPLHPGPCVVSGMFLFLLLLLLLLLLIAAAADASVTAAAHAVVASAGATTAAATGIAPAAAPVPITSTGYCRSCCCLSGRGRGAPATHTSTSGRGRGGALATHSPVSSGSTGGKSNLCQPAPPLRQSSRAPYSCLSSGSYYITNSTNKSQPSMQSLNCNKNRVSDVECPVEAPAATRGPGLSAIFQDWNSLFPCSIFDVPCSWNAAACFHLTVSNRSPSQTIETNGM